MNAEELRKVSEDNVQKLADKMIKNIAIEIVKRANIGYNSWTQEDINLVPPLTLKIVEKHFNDLGFKTSLSVYSIDLHITW